MAEQAQRRPLRFMQRMQRQSETLFQVFGEPQDDAPPYGYSNLGNVPISTHPSSAHSRKSSISTSKSHQTTATSNPRRTRSRQSSAATSTSIAPVELPASVPEKPLPSTTGDQGSPPPCFDAVSLQSPPPYRPAENSNDKTEEVALPKGSLVLVTAANCWQGVHIVDQLLEHGYNVRGAVRDDEKAAWTTEFFTDKYGATRYSTAVVPDMTVSGAYNTAVKGCAGVIHVASVMTMSPNPNEVIPQTINGALNALIAAAEEPLVTRFVYTSSILAAANSSYRDVQSRSDIVTADSWNITAVKDAWAAPPYAFSRAWSVFAASKAQTEQAVWQWHLENKPNFVLNCVLPGMTWGEVITPEQSGTGISMHILRSIYYGASSQICWIPPHQFADVQDSALIHLAALTLSSVANERLFVTASPYNVNSIILLLQKINPERRIGGRTADHDIDRARYKDASRSEDLLRKLGRKGWTDMETSVRNACESFSNARRATFYSPHHIDSTSAGNEHNLVIGSC